MAIDIISSKGRNVLWGTVNDEALGTFYAFPGFLECLRDAGLDLDDFTKEDFSEVRTFDTDDWAMVEYFYGEKKEDDILAKILPQLQRYGVERYLPAKVIDWDTKEVELVKDREYKDGNYLEEEREWRGVIEATTTWGIFQLPFHYHYFGSTENGGEGGNLDEGFEEIIELKDGDGRVIDDGADMAYELESFFEEVLDEDFRKELEKSD
jgi:hypothetical protein